MPLPIAFSIGSIPTIRRAKTALNPTTTPSLGYQAKNGPIDTIEELLLVKGVTPQSLFGSDANRNGTIDASEQSLPQLAESNDADQEMDRGWASYLTIYGKEANIQPDGTPKINLNSDDLQTLHDSLAQYLTPEEANFISRLSVIRAIHPACAKTSVLQPRIKFHFASLSEPPQSRGAFDRGFNLSTTKPAELAVEVREAAVWAAVQALVAEELEAAALENQQAEVAEVAEVVVAVVEVVAVVVVTRAKLKLPTRSRSI